MAIAEVIGNMLNSSNVQSDYIKFQSLIHKSKLKSNDIRTVQTAFTTFLKEKEKPYCEMMIETLQAFLQKYNESVGDWLYVLLLQVIRRLSYATMPNHIRSLNDTSDLIRNLFSQKVLLKLSFKFVMDKTQTNNSTVKYNLLQFIRQLIVSSKPEFLSETETSDSTMAISRIILWTADIKSEQVRQESERVIIKMFNLNPDRFTQIIKQLPEGFRDRCKILLKESLIFNSLLVAKEKKTTKPSQEKRRDDVNEKAATLHPRAKNKENGISFKKIHGNLDKTYKKINSSIESLITDEVLQPNYPTVTYDQRRQMQHKLRQNPPHILHHQQSNGCCQEDTEDNLVTASVITQQITSAFSGEIENHTDSCGDIKLHRHKSQHVHQHNHDKIKRTKHKKSKKQHSSSEHPKSSSHKLYSRESHKITQKQNTFPQTTMRPDSNILAEAIAADTDIKDVIQKLSYFNERHQERKLSLICLIKAINMNIVFDWHIYFKPLMSTLLETLNDNEGGTRKLSIFAIQELSKIQPQRFQDQISKIIERLLYCFIDTDYGVVEAATSCSLTLSQTLNVDSLWRSLNLLLVDRILVVKPNQASSNHNNLLGSAAFGGSSTNVQHTSSNNTSTSPNELLSQINSINLQCSGLRFLYLVIKSASAVIVVTLMVETLSMLNKLTIHSNLLIRKNSIFCLLAIYSKVGDRIWPHLKDFNTKQVNLLKMYIHRLK